jgi:hypothetical protein
MTPANIYTQRAQRIRRRRETKDGGRNVVFFLFLFRLLRFFAFVSLNFKYETDPLPASGEKGEQQIWGSAIAAAPCRLVREPYNIHTAIINTRNDGKGINGRRVAKLLVLRGGHRGRGEPKTTRGLPKVDHRASVSLRWWRRYGGGAGGGGNAQHFLHLPFPSPLPH